MREWVRGTVSPTGLPWTQHVFNQHLDPRRGELLRLDVIDREDGGSDVTFSWNHTLMDSHGAESALALLGSRSPARPRRTPGTRWR